MTALLAANAAASGAQLAQASAWAVFLIGAVLILAGAFGVILMRNPVHSALMLVVTLFGVAVEFIDQQADFLAAVQIVVYAGAIVILFLFVIMFLGVDRREAIGSERFKAQKPVAVVLGAVTLVELLVVSRTQDWTSGLHGFGGDLTVSGDNVNKVGQAIYTSYLLPFEMTSALLVIAVVAAVVLARGQERTAGELTAREQSAPDPQYPAGQEVEP
ncbi:MAG: NADH-quinone oxidoreductase subunit J family protein [Acidimicrobiales bacterium]